MSWTLPISSHWHASASRRSSPCSLFIQGYGQGHCVPDLPRGQRSDVRGWLRRAAAQIRVSELGQLLEPDRDKLLLSPRSSRSLAHGGTPRFWSTTDPGGGAACPCGWRCSSSGRELLHHGHSASSRKTARRGDSRPLGAGSQAVVRTCSSSVVLPAPLGPSNPKKLSLAGSPGRSPRAPAVRRSACGLRGARSPQAWPGRPRGKSARCRLEQLGDFRRAWSRFCIAGGKLGRRSAVFPSGARRSHPGQEPPRRNRLRHVGGSRSLAPLPQVFFRCADQGRHGVQVTAPSRMSESPLAPDHVLPDLVRSPGGSRGERFDQAVHAVLANFAREVSR